MAAGTRETRDDRGRQTAGERPDPLVVRSHDLFRGRHEVQIEHDGQTYRLRVTRSGKLILNK